MCAVTEGESVLGTGLFNAGFRAAINAGVAVSRVGGAAQTKIIKKLGGGIRLAMAQYRELAAFAQFASDLDDVTRAQLERGQRVMELMEQKQYSPLSIAEMAVSLFAVENAFLDDIELDKIGDFEAALHNFMNSDKSDLIKQINDSGDLNDDIEAALRSSIEEFKKNHSW